MRAMTLKDSTGASPRESVYMAEPVSVVGLSIDDEMWRFLELFAESTGLVQLRARTAGSRAGLDQDAVVEFLGSPAPEICLVDFDRDRRTAAIVSERVHTALPQMAVFAVSSQTQPDAILEAMRAGCSEYLIKPIDR
jgi:DNA-binding NarL/FixJ family response regulator